jgi:hypothetical protein
MAYHILTFWILWCGSTISTFAAPGEDDQRHRIAADLAKGSRSGATADTGVAQAITADRKVLGAPGVTITVDRPLREAVIQDDLGQIVASRLSSDAQNLWEASG